MTRKLWSVRSATLSASIGSLVSRSRKLGGVRANAFKTIASSTISTRFAAGSLGRCGPFGKASRFVSIAINPVRLLAAPADAPVVKALHRVEMPYAAQSDLTRA